ncbi:MAG: nucleoside-diphosphate kinase [Patescibacteria group bacterium]
MDKNYLKYKKQRTLILVKPDGVAKNLIGEIIARFERAGLKVIGLGILMPTKKQIDGHYPKDTDWLKGLGQNTLNTCEKYGIDVKKTLGLKQDDSLTIGKMVREWTITFVSSGSIVKMALEGPHAIDIVRKLIGKTLPLTAEPGTIRGDFSCDSPVLANLEKRAVANIVHASGNEKEAEFEINYWFKKGELVDL